jgi:hypothetical protein
LFRDSKEVVADRLRSFSDTVAACSGHKKKWGRKVQIALDLRKDEEEQARARPQHLHLL